jgi:hypothetical protein
MPAPSSRSLDPRLVAASGVMRDTVGALHNFQHLLGSVRVGPKALARVVPDVRASAGPMIAAARELVLGARALGGAPSMAELGQLVIVRMTELEKALSDAARSSLRASDRLRLEAIVTSAVRDLDGALELVELMVEASASGSVPVDVMDVIRESGVRPDTGSGRGRRIHLVVTPLPGPVAVRVNPRVALRLAAFAAAIVAGGGDGVRVEIRADAASCHLAFAPSAASGGFLVAVPPLIDLSERAVREVAAGSGAGIERAGGGPEAILTFPVAAHE